METQQLTDRQQQILDFISERIADQGYPPSVREIGEAIGLSSPSTVHAHLNALEEKGYIKRDASKSRSMVITDKGDDELEYHHRDIIGADEYLRSVTQLPLVGRVAAGTPILAEQNVEEEIPLPVSLVGDRNSFLLTVKGDSMIDVGIFDGDIVVVREQKTADNGDIVVALIDDEATVKTYYRERDCIRLQPQNPTLEPIFTRDAQIVGIVTGLFRSL